MVIPNTSSERREYVPIGWLGPEVIANQKLRILPNATLADFALLTSAMHMAWMRTVTGRLESRYMYSVGVVYNTFPTPPGSADRSKLETLAQAVLDARAAHPEATLADLYDPDLMTPNLRRLITRWTAPWIASTVALASRPNASASSICSLSTSACKPACCGSRCQAPVTTESAPFTLTW